MCDWFVDSPFASATYPDHLFFFVSLVVLYSLVLSCDQRTGLTSPVSVFIMEIQTFYSYITESFIILCSKGAKKKCQKLKAKNNPIHEAYSTSLHPFPSHQLLQFIDAKDSTRVQTRTLGHSSLDFRSDFSPISPKEVPSCLSYSDLFVFKDR